MLKKLLKKISFLRKKRKIKLLQNLYKESDGVSLLDVGAAGNIMPRWVSVARYLNYIGVEPDKRTNQELKNIYNCSGFLIGGASLKYKSFTNLIKNYYK